MTYSARQLSAVDEYLTECFTTFELMQFCEQVGGAKVAAELPGANQSRASFAFDAVRVLARHGLVDSRFFDILARLRPVRRADAQRLAALVLRDPLGDAEQETVVWRAAEALDARRLTWVEALEDELLKRDQCTKDDEWVEIDRKIDTLARHLRGTSHVGPGSVVAGARLERPLGSGNFGTVWYAHHLESGHPVATKIFNLDRCTDELMLWRFRRSIRALKQLGDYRDVPRAICRVHDVSPDTLAFCMPYFSGGNLEKVERRGWSLATKVAVFLEVCRAVAFAHSTGVIHRDIKPANILIDADHHPVLIDFDIADIRFVTELEGERAGVGTPVFAAPEQLERADAADERSDVYSLGRLLYYLLLERSPGFQREDDPSLDNLRGFAPALVAIIRRATQAKPDRRYLSVPQLVAAVEHYPTGLAAVRARFRAASRWMREHLAVATVGMTLLSTSMTLNYIQERRASERARFTEEGKRALDAATEHGMRVRRGILRVAVLAQRIATIEGEWLAVARDGEVSRRADQMRTLLRDLQRDLEVLSGDIEIERNVVQQILSFDPAGLVPVSQPHRLAVGATSPAFASTAAVADDGGARAVPYGPLAPASRFSERVGDPRTRPKRAAKSQLEARSCNEEFLEVIRSVEPRVCALIRYPSEAVASVVVDIDAFGRFEGWVPSRDLERDPAIKELFRQMEYPQSCARESRNAKLCHAKVR